MNVKSAFALIGLPLMLSGCSQQTITSANHDAQTDARVVQREAQRAERKIDPQVKSLSLGGRVSAAISLNVNLPKTIRVDANPEGVRLSGTVRTKEQKALAARVAKDTLPPDKSVSNSLQIVP